MAIQLMGLPQLRIQEQGLDAAPLTRAIQGYTAGSDAATQFANTKAVGQTAATGDLKAAARQAMGLGETDLGMQYQQRATQDEATIKKRLGSMAQAVEMEADPNRRNAMWQRVLKMVPGGATNLAPEEMDPMTGPKMLMAEAGIVVDPLERQQKQGALQLQQAQIGKLNREAATAGQQFGKAGTIVQDRDGRFYSVQFGANGEKRVEPLAIGENALQPTRGVDQVGDTLIDKATGGVVRNVAPNLQNAERVKQIGDVQGKAQAAAAGDITAADAAMELVGSIRNDPNRWRGTGASAVFNAVPYTKGYDFQKKVEQAKSGAFLQAIQQLRGMGALSNAEGQTATAAVTRMSTSMTEEGFIEALNDYERVVTKGREQAMKRGSAVQQPQAEQPANGGWSMQRID